MKTKYKFLIPSKCPFRMVCTVSVMLLSGVLASSAQTGDYWCSVSEKTIILNPGIYDITAYGAQGGFTYDGVGQGGLGAEMEAEFNFASAVNLTILVGGAGADANWSAGGGGGSFVVNGTTPLVIAGGGGGGGAGNGVGNGGVGTSGSAGVGNYEGNTAGSGGSGGTGGAGTTGGYAGGGGGGGYSGNGGTGLNGSSGEGGDSFLNGGEGGGYSAGGGGNIGGYGGGGGGGSVSGFGLGGGGGAGGYSGGGGGFAAHGGGGGSYINSSAVAVIAEVSGVESPGDSPNGEVIINLITSVPALFISYSGNAVTVYWQNVSGWSLQQNTNLASPTSWTASSGIITNNGTNYLNVTNPTGSLFFRLSY